MWYLAFQDDALILLTCFFRRFTCLNYFFICFDETFGTSIYSFFIWVRLQDHLLIHYRKLLHYCIHIIIKFILYQMSWADFECHSSSWLFPWTSELGTRTTSTDKIHHCWAPMDHLHQALPMPSFPLARQGEELVPDISDTLLILVYDQRLLTYYSFTVTHKYKQK